MPEVFKELKDLTAEELALAQAWHEIWSERKLAQGDKSHPSLVPFDQLPLESTNKRVWLGSQTARALALSKKYLDKSKAIVKAREDRDFELEVDREVVRRQDLSRAAGDGNLYDRNAVREEILAKRKPKEPAK